ncbi:DinB family protein [Paenibacillus sp. IHBB 10380]|uniref:DinB family protein n=1 Tax=Paenibacillus sp. IHBB 10380 TaxID=1566358 RepID=UPI0005CFE143|nr:DinB family protein [Paenibacillus sp. IHBB 10380]AJS58965.1 hypothetical protein UB51_11320 [Paenibacillus sp. IHBB 10380]
MKQQLISDLNEFLTFVGSLEYLKDEVWFSPISEGKWRIHDIVVHIMKWDDYFNNVTFPTLSQSKFPELMEHPDYLGFNEQSISYGKGKTKKEIIAEAVRNRQIMVSKVSELEDNKFLVVYSGDRGFTKKSYLTEFFISHDQYHKEQIQDYLKSKQQI